MKIIILLEKVIMVVGMNVWKWEKLKGNIYYFDFTSLYPDVGRQNLPYGKPERINLDNNKTLPNDFFGFVECLVKTKDKSILPKHCITKDNQLIFPIFDNWTKILYFLKN